MDDMDNEQEQPQPVEAPAPVVAAAAPDLSRNVQGYHAAQPVGVLVRMLANTAGLTYGNVPAKDAEPIISYVRWDHTAAEALDELARICGAKWDVQGGALNFVIGG